MASKRWGGRGYPPSYAGERGCVLKTAFAKLALSGSSVNKDNHTAPPLFDLMLLRVQQMAQPKRALELAKSTPNSQGNAL